MLSKIKSIILSSAILFAGINFANTEELNVPGFTGNINTTVSTGVQIRVDENCVGQTGSVNVAGDTTFAAAVNSTRTAADAAVLLQDGEPGCAKIYQDGYGNMVPYTMGDRLDSNTHSTNYAVMARLDNDGLTY